MDKDEGYELPEGWIPCDACGRPVHFSNMDAHIGSAGCLLEQNPASEPPKDWVSLGLPAYYGSRDFTKHSVLRRARAPMFKHTTDTGTTWWSPKWAVMIADSLVSADIREWALVRARRNFEYRSQVIAGLRLVNADDHNAIETILKGP